MQASCLGSKVLPAMHYQNLQRQNVWRITAKTQHTSVYELAKAFPLDKSKTSNAFDRVFEFYSATATCSVGEKLANKYNVAQDNGQFVVSIRNKFSFEQTWFNCERAKKPQNFTATASSTVEDPTENGMNCDFCDWPNLTAVDDFGRVEFASVVSGSNLFKYCAPSHGVLVFKHHHPLEFSLSSISDLMKCTHEWVDRAAGLHPDARYPLFVWNCLARAGASQFHGHAQVMLSPVPFPCYESLRAATEAYSFHHPNKSYLSDLLLAYEDLGLLKTIQNEDAKCVLYPSLTPWKDMEVVLWTNSLHSTAFHSGLFLVLQTLMKEFGMLPFNVGIQGIPLKTKSTENGIYPFPSSEVGSIMARVVSRGKVTSKASDFGGLEVFGGASIGHTDPFDISRSLDHTLTTNQTLPNLSN